MPLKGFKMSTEQRAKCVAVALARHAWMKPHEVMTVDGPVVMKTCNRCKVDKPLSAFGYCNSCKDCVNQRGRAKRDAWRQLHPRLPKPARTTHVCSICRTEKLLTEFHATGKYKDGSVRYDSHCRDCVSVEDKGARRARIQLLVNACGNKCVRCGGTFDQVVYDFHHRDATTKATTICSMVSRRHSFEELLVEAKKCDLLCANCHRLVHKELGGNGYHGRRSVPKDRG